MPIANSGTLRWRATILSYTLSALNGRSGHGLRIMAYTCPMHPEIRRANPGKCPKCGADLVPVGTTPHGQRSVIPRRGDRPQPTAQLPANHAQQRIA